MQQLLKSLKDFLGVSKRSGIVTGTSCPVFPTVRIWKGVSRCGENMFREYLIWIVGTDECGAAHAIAFFTTTLQMYYLHQIHVLEQFKQYVECVIGRVSVIHMRVTCPICHGSLITFFFPFTRFDSSLIRGQLILFEFVRLHLVHYEKWCGIFRGAVPRVLVTIFITEEQA